MAEKNFSDRFNDKGSSKFPEIRLDGHMRQCVHCERDVRPVKRPAWLLLAVLAVLTFFFFIVGIVLIAAYLAYYVLLQRKECPICRGKSFRMTDRHREQ